MDYKEIYRSYFNLGGDIPVYCEYMYAKFGAMILAGDVHHIMYRSRGGNDDIRNLMALSREIHDKAHSEDLKFQELMDIHIEFLNINPY